MLIYARPGPTLPHRATGLRVRPYANRRLSHKAARGGHVPLCVPGAVRNLARSVPAA